MLAGSGRAIAVHLERDAYAGRGGAGDEVAEAVQARRRPPRRVLAGAAQHTEHRADLAQRVGARLVDRRQRDPRLAGLLVHQLQGDAGLDVDQRNVVRQHVVQLAGDAQPLLVGLAAGLELARPLGLREALLAAADPLDAGQRHEQPGGDRERRQHLRPTLGPPECPSAHGSARNTSQPTPSAARASTRSPARAAETIANPSDRKFGPSG